MLKAWLRYLIAEELRFTGMLGYMERPARDALTILCYHRVLPAAAKERYFLSDLVVTPEALHEHAVLLGRRHRILPLADAFVAWQKGKTKGKPLAAITFDDGYRDNFVHAKPALESAGVRGTFFVVAGLIGSATAPWYDRLGRACQHLNEAGRAGEVLEHLRNTGCTATICQHLQTLDAVQFPIDVVEAAKLLPPWQREELLATLIALAGGDDLDPRLDEIMTQDQLRAMHAAGHEIASHSQTHPILTQLTGDTLDAEIAGSRDALTAMLGVAPRTFCYPNGDHNPEVLAAVQAAGYQAAVTTQQGINLPGTPPLTLSRVFVHETRLARPSGGVSATLFRLELTPFKHRLHK